MSFFLEAASLSFLSQTPARLPRRVGVPSSSHAGSRSKRPCPPGSPHSVAVQVTASGSVSQSRRSTPRLAKLSAQSEPCHLSQSAPSSRHVAPVRLAHPRLPLPSARGNRPAFPSPPLSCPTACRREAVQGIRLSLPCLPLGGSCSVFVSQRVPGNRLASEDLALPPCLGNRSPNSSVMAKSSAPTKCFAETNEDQRSRRVKGSVVGRLVSDARVSTHRGTRFLDSSSRLALGQLRVEEKMLD